MYCCCAILTTDLTAVEQIHRLSLYAVIVGGIVFFAVLGSIVYSLIHFRAKENPGIPSQKPSDERMEKVLLVIVTVVTAVFVWLTFSVMSKVGDIPEHPKPDVLITGHQWWWEAKYPKTGVITANQIHIPAGRKVLLELHSADVIHSWWVQQLGQKMDMIPGQANYLWLYAEKPGVYLGTCSEFCGADHANMRIRVTAMDTADFSRWSQDQLRPAVAMEDPLFVEGARLFQQKTCTNCHSIQGVAAKMTIGPDLTHFASRKRFLADMMEINDTNLRAWLKDPQQVKPGAHMPNFILSKKELDALTYYIGHLK